LDDQGSAEGLFCTEQTFTSILSGMYVLRFGSGRLPTDKARSQNCSGRLMQRKERSRRWNSTHHTGIQPMRGAMGY